MKKVMIVLFLGIFLMSFAFAAYGEQDQERNVASVDTAGVNVVNAARVDAETEAEIRERIMDGEYDFDGARLRIENKDALRTRLRARNISADTELELQQKQDNARRILQARLSNGENAEIKIMPDVASLTALARLRLRVCSEDNNCTIELKEVGQGNQTRAAYELRAEKQARVLGLFRARMQVASQVDAETGEVIAERRPWWSFLATEQDETATETQ